MHVLILMRSVVETETHSVRSQVWVKNLFSGHRLRFVGSLNIVKSLKSVDYLKVVGSPKST